MAPWRCGAGDMVATRRRGVDGAEVWRSDGGAGPAAWWSNAAMRGGRLRS
jgi:pyridoxal biosynthesis lyase PdxS